ncbi:MAG: hypothetical protein MdMp024_0041 [Bacteroidales bacterium]
MKTIKELERLIFGAAKNEYILCLYGRLEDDDAETATISHGNIKNLYKILSAMIREELPDVLNTFTPDGDIIKDRKKFTNADFLFLFVAAFAWLDGKNRAEFLKLLTKIDMQINRDEEALFF